MIYGLGTDIFEVSRMREVMDRDTGFRDKIFTQSEIDYCEKMVLKHQNYAARFSAKEAFLKALGTGWRFGISFTEIEIYHNTLGKPEIRLSGKAGELAKQEGITNVHVSVSHIREMVSATVILEKNDRNEQ